MSDNIEKPETKSADHQDLEQQQQALFRELSREQTEAEQAREGDQERLTGEPQDESDD